MCLATNISRRAGSASYYARLAVPKDLQPILGRRELWKSLNTKDAREARALVAAVVAEWHAEFGELRRRHAARPATPDDLQTETWTRYTNELDRHHAERRTSPSPEKIDAAKASAVATIRGERVTDPIAQINVAAEAIALAGQAELSREMGVRRRAELERHIARGEFVLVADVAREIIRSKNYAIEPGTPEWRDLCERLMRAEIEGHRRDEEHDRGDWTGTPRDPIVKPPAGKPVPPVAAPGEGVLDLLAPYADDNAKRLTPDTIRVNRQIVGMFVDFVGATLPPRAIDKARVFAWKSALRRYPIRAAEITEFKGISFRQIIAANERIGRPVLSDKTVNRYLSALGGFCTWAHRNGHMDDNPVIGMLIEKDQGPSKVRSYNADQLTSIFGSPVFTGCLADGKEHKPGKLRPRDHRFWLPLLALFTGARMGELAQLMTADVRQDRGRWIVHITREGAGGKSTKTKGSQRVVPVHPELERLGFIAFHAARAAAGDRLFPEIEPDARGQLTGNVSRWWGRYVKRIGVKDDASVNFHSFRHGMADALRRAGYRDEEFGFLLGHAKATTTGRYGILAEGELTQRCKMIDAISFPDVDLNHLYLDRQTT